MTTSFPCGLVARIWRSHRHGPGSIPGMGNILERRLVKFVLVWYNNWKFFVNIIKFDEKGIKRSINSHNRVNRMKSLWEAVRRWLFSGRILACHAGDRGFDSPSTQINKRIIFSWCSSCSIYRENIFEWIPTKYFQLKDILPQ